MFPKNFFQCISTLLGAMVVFVIFLTTFPHLKPDSILFDIFYCLIFGGINFLIVFYINKKRKIAMSFHWIPNISTASFLWIFIIIFLYILGKSCLVNSFFPFQQQERGLVWLIFPLLGGPMVEEFVFRGIYLKGLISGSKYSVTTSIWGISIIFALIHYNAAPQTALLDNVFIILNAFILSLYMSWLFYKTMNVGNTIIVHILANSWSLFLQYIFSNFQNQMLPYNIFFRICGTILISSSFIYFLLSKNKLKWN